MRDDRRDISAGRSRAEGAGRRRAGGLVRGVDVLVGRDGAGVRELGSVGVVRGLGSAGGGLTAAWEVLGGVRRENEMLGEDPCIERTREPKRFVEL